MNPSAERQNPGVGAYHTAPLISVVICTHNRSKYLLKAIRSVLGQDYPEDRYELVVIDNASTDSTADQVRPFLDTGRLRYVLEPELGISFARNTGWREAAGRYIAYLDDDAVASPGWLSAIEKAADSMRARWAVGSIRSGRPNGPTGWPMTWWRALVLSIGPKNQKSSPICEWNGW